MKFYFLNLHTLFYTPANLLVTRINTGFLWLCGLFKLVSQEFYSDNFNSTFAILGRYIRHIRRHIFYCHKNCTQNVLMHQANNLFWYTKVISRYCIRSWILLSTSQTLPRTFYYTFCTNISFETAALYVLKVYILL